MRREWHAVHLSPCARASLQAFPCFIELVLQLLAWNGIPIPDKPLDALRQIVPRVNGWCTLRVEVGANAWGRPALGSSTQN